MLMLLDNIDYYLLRVWVFFFVWLHASVVLPYYGASQPLALWHQAEWSLLDWTDPTSPQPVLSDNSRLACVGAGFSLGASWLLYRVSTR
jgi:hypothetical protein